MQRTALYTNIQSCRSPCVDVLENLTRIRKARLRRKPGASLQEGKSHVRTQRTDAEDHQDPRPGSSDHVERNPARVVVTVAGRVIADTREALTLSEAHYSAVQYIPARMFI